jgi:hypothetical protein
MTIDNKSPDKAESREKHVKEHLAEMTDADLDKVAGGIEAAPGRDIIARKRAEEQRQALQRILESQQSFQESEDAKQRQIIRNI